MWKWSNLNSLKTFLEKYHISLYKFTGTRKYAVKLLTNTDLNKQQKMNDQSIPNHNNEWQWTHWQNNTSWTKKKITRYLSQCSLVIPLLWCKITNKQSRHLINIRKLTSNLLKRESLYMACLNKDCMKISTICYL